MTAKQKIHQAHLADWASKISNQQASGLTVRDWCRQNNLSLHKYNYWKHLLKEEYVDSTFPEIAPVSLSSVSCNNHDPSPSQISDVSIPYRENCTNRAIRANCTMCNLTINGLSLSIDESVSEEFLTTLIKAVRYA